MRPDDILDFWLGALDDDGLSASVYQQRWWTKDEAFDAQIRARFEPLWKEVMAGGQRDWLHSAEGRLAHVIVLDQFSRNMYRGTPEAFAGDARALELANEGIALGQDRSLPGQARGFLYMPFMHSEALADQERCVALFSSFRDQSSGRLREVLSSNVSFAAQHRDIIARFGRFPHRNAQLERTSTEEELAFLTQPGSSF